VHPANAFIICIVVAGLQAIATAKRLGAVVTAFDTRPVAGEQAQSLGAEFVAMDVHHAEAEDAGGYAKEQTADFYKQEQDLIRKYSKDADIIITTALIPGKRAPLLITEEMVKEMKPGSVIVDLAVEMGGNCALSEPAKDVVKHGVTVLGVVNLPSGLPVHSSLLYAKNILAFLNLILPDGKTLQLDTADEIIKGSMITHNGEVTHPALKK
jgi:NAD(P) transhydrogenase subunit alpha